jgi:hypothetical protein
MLATTYCALMIERAHRGLLDDHLAPIGIELFSHDQRQSGRDALTHLGRRRLDGDDAIRCDRHVCIEASLRRLRTGWRRGSRSSYAKTECKGKACRAAEECAPADIEIEQCEIVLVGVDHDEAPAAARSIARTMLLYVPQRHRLPFIWRTICSREGFLLRASSAAACMIWPDWQ